MLKQVKSATQKQNKRSLSVSFIQLNYIILLHGASRSKNVPATDESVSWLWGWLICWTMPNKTGGTGRCISFRNAFALWCILWKWDCQASLDAWACKIYLVLINNSNNRKDNATGAIEISCNFMLSWSWTFTFTFGLDRMHSIYKWERNK